MTATDRELGGLVRDWLTAGSTTLSEWVYTGAMAEISTTPQRRRIPLLERRPTLPRTTRFALIGSAAIALIAAVGIGFLLSRPGPAVGPNVATPASSGPPASPSGSPDPTDAQPTPVAVSRGTIDAIDGLAISFDVPQGWSKTGEAAYGRTPDRYAPHPPDGVEVSFWEVDEIPSIPAPCPTRGRPRRRPISMRRSGE